MKIKIEKYSQFVHEFRERLAFAPTEVGDFILNNLNKFPFVERFDIHYSEVKVFSSFGSFQDLLKKYYSLEYTQTFDETDLNKFIADLWEVYDKLTTVEKSYLDILFYRAIAPLDSLNTFSLENFFTEDEINEIKNIVKNNETVPPASLDWSLETGINYENYVCLIVKFTRLCNLRCTYCNDWRQGPNNTMKSNVILQMINKVLNSQNSIGTIDFIWHGGEPTLLGENFFLKVLALQSWFKSPQQQIFNRVQSNAVNINLKWACFFKYFNIKIGISIDGPKVIHDKNRVDIKVRGTYDKVINGINMLKRYNLISHIYLVVTEDIIEYGANRLLSFFQNLGVENIGLIPVIQNNLLLSKEEIYLDRGKYFLFLIDIHKARLQSKGSWVKFRELDALLRTVSNQNPSFCELLGNCVGAYFSIEPNGDVTHCDRFLGDSDYVLGNVLTESFQEILSSEKIKQISLDNQQSLAKVKDCDYFSYCKGWCPHERYIIKKTNQNENCCGMSFFFRQYEKQMSAEFMD